MNELVIPSRLRLRIPSNEILEVERLLANHPGTFDVLSVDKYAVEAVDGLNLGDYSEVLMVIHSATVVAELGLLLWHIKERNKALNMAVKGTKGEFDPAQCTTLEELINSLIQILTALKSIKSNRENENE